MNARRITRNTHRGRSARATDCRFHIYNAVVAPSPAEIEHAARLLRAGRLVAFPTETVYGLGANALDPDAVARIFAVKGRPSTSPLIVHVGSIEMAKSLVAEWPDAAERLSRRFWPGPLTIVLPTRSSAMAGGATAELRSAGQAGMRVPTTVPPIVTAGLPTVGLRMPDHPVALALLRAAGVPLAAPSANRFTELSPTTAEHVRRSLSGEVDYILDGGPCQVGIESTVLSLAGPEFVLLRPGGILRRELESLVGPIGSSHEAPAGAHPSPGMHPRHYSPRTPMLLVKDGKLPQQGKGIYLRHTRAPSRSDARIVQMPSSAEEYAAALYGKLHEADLAGVNWIAVEQPPNTPEWEAVLDRLRRAAAG